MATTTAPTKVSRSSYWRELWERRDFTLHLARGSLASSVAGTTLGRVWWLINPLLMSGVYFLVFGVIITGTSRSNSSFLAYLIVGVLVFRFLSVGLIGSGAIIISNTKLIANLRFPRMVLPLAAVIDALATFLAGLAVFYLLVTPVSCLQAAGNSDITCITPTYRIALLPLAVAIQFAFTLGIGAFVARIIVPNRDARNLIPHLTRIWFYLSPILWGVERLANQTEFLQAIIKSNPMFSILSIYRTALINDPFEPAMLALAAAWAVVMLTFGVWSFRRHEATMARYV